MATLDDAANPPPQHDDYSVLRLKSSYETFGVVIEYLARTPPYAKYDLGNFAGVVQRQIHEGNHRAALTRNQIVGYLGWLPTTEKAAVGWLRGEGVLAPLAPGEASNAVALTVVAARDRTVLSLLIRAARDANPDTRVYFKREYAGVKTARKHSVRNTTGAERRLLPVAAPQQRDIAESTTKETWG